MWTRNQYLSEISYHQENHTRILGNKDKRRSKISEGTFHSGHILQKENLHEYTSYRRRSESNFKLTFGFPQSMGWWNHEHDCPNTLWSSIHYHASQWLYECSNRIWLSWSIFNTLPFASVVIWILQQKLPAWVLILSDKTLFIFAWFSSYN